MRQFKVVGVEGTLPFLKAVRSGLVYGMCDELQTYVRKHNLTGKTIGASLVPVEGAVRFHRSKRQPEPTFDHWTTGRERIVLCKGETKFLKDTSEFWLVIS